MSGALKYYDTSTGTWKYVARGVEGPQGPQGPAGASGSGTGNVTGPGGTGNAGSVPVFGNDGGTTLVKSTIDNTGGGLAVDGPIASKGSGGNYSLTNAGNQQVFNVATGSSVLSGGTAPYANMMLDGTTYLPLIVLDEVAPTSITTDQQYAGASLLYQDNTDHKLKVAINGGTIDNVATEGYVAAHAGTGNVVGPASATNTAIARFDTTTGKLLKNSVVTISDTGDIFTSGHITSSNEIDTDYIAAYAGITGGTQMLAGLATNYISGRTSGAGKIAFMGYGQNSVLDLVAPVGSNLLTDYLKITSIVAGSPTLEATGNSTNISINIKSKGSGVIQANGVQVADVSSAQTLINKTLDNTTVETIKAANFTLQDATDTTKQAKFDFSNLTTASTRTYSFPNTTGTIADLGTVQTFVNKRITARVQTVTSAATITPAGDTNDLVVATAQAVALTLANPTGTPTDGQKLMVRLKATGAFAITYGTLYLSSGVATLPTTTVSGKTITLGLTYDATAAKWVCLAVDATGY